MFYGVPNFERQAVDMNIKVGTFRVMFQVTFVMITTKILQTRMLTANSRIRDFQLIISLPIIQAVIGTCPCANSLDHLDHFTVNFSSRQKFTFLFSRKLFEFGAYANSLDHLDCSNSVLAVFYNIYFFISGANFSPHQ